MRFCKCDFEHVYFRIKCVFLPQGVGLELLENSHFSQKSHFKSQFFSKNRFFKIAFFTKVTLFQILNSCEFMDKKCYFAPVWS